MSATILIVDDEDHFRQNIGEFLTQKGYEVLGAATLKDAKEFVKKGSADIILLDVQLPDGYGPDLLEEVAGLPWRPPIILITGYGNVEMAVDAMKCGAHDFFQKPIQFGQLEKSILRAQEIVSMRRELAHLRSTQGEGMNFVGGKSVVMKRTLMQAERAARMSVSVLITGETGTGKDILAHAIHKMGPRSNQPFIPINCAAIQTTMLESELFGYEAGAFTGADKRKPGMMEVADKGILFLDEISSAPLEVQAKLLRVIEDQCFFRVGGTREIKVDVQILAASNRDLPTMMREGQFREDLYYRLKVVDLNLPPLRDRKEDLADLVGMFMRNNNSKLGLNITGITPLAMKALQNHNWPGNIRELRNTIERAMLFCDEAEIDLHNLPPEFTN